MQNICILTFFLPTHKKREPHQEINPDTAPLHILYDYIFIFLPYSCVVDVE